MLNQKEKTINGETSRYRTALFQAKPYFLKDRPKNVQTPTFPQGDKSWHGRKHYIRYRKIF